jgi:serine/threonine protein kinase
VSEISFGKFQIRRELGRGAMGVVYEAYDPSRGVDVALKVMQVSPRATREQREKQMERFFREARTLEECSHFHIVRVFEDGEFAGRCFLSMELLRGTTLRDRIQYQGPLSLTELVRLSLELCGALDHIHTRGIIHRDIKPENIMLLPDGRSKLMDFGIARLALEEGLPGGGGFQGSPAYMSPEQVAGMPVDGRTDIYSLAITLYEAATGRRAFEGDSVPVIVNKVVQEYPAPPVGLPPAFQAVLMRAMAKDPALRYATGREMAGDIQAGRAPKESFSPIGAAAGSAWPAPPARSGQRTACPSHPTAAAVGICSHCRRPACYTCLLEVPRRGLLCRTCVFR